MYFHYSQFESELHLYARKLNEYAIPIVGFLIIWVFGNEFFFPLDSNEQENFQKITGNFSENFTVFTPSTQIEIKQVESGYYAAFERRASNTSLSQLVMLVVFGYIVYIIATYIVRIIINLNAFEILKSKGKKLNRERSKKIHVGYFEDLVSHSDILYGKTLMKVMRGREDYGENVKNMHKYRNRRLWRNLKRDRRRLRRIRKVDIEEGQFNEKKIARTKFQTLSSYDYKVDLI